MNPKSITSSDTPPFNLFERVERDVIDWAMISGIEVHCIHWIPAFTWPGGTSVWIFSKSNTSLISWKAEGWEEKLKEQLVASLLKHGFHQELAEKVDFTFDSDQNVQENFEGSYFYRLR